MTKPAKWLYGQRRRHPPSLIRVVAVRMKKPQVLSYPLSAQRRLWSDWADAQADLSSLGAEQFCWFCHKAAQTVYCSKCKLLSLGSNSRFHLDYLHWSGRGWAYRNAVVALVNNSAWLRNSQGTNTLLYGCNKMRLSCSRKRKRFICRIIRKL